MLWITAVTKTSEKSLPLWSLHFSGETNSKQIKYMSHEARLEGWGAEWGGDGVRLGTSLSVEGACGYPNISPPHPDPNAWVSPAYPLARSFLISTSIPFCTYSDPAPRGPGERKFQAHSCPRVAHNPVGEATFVPLDTGVRWQGGLTRLASRGTREPWPSHQLRGPNRGTEGQNCLVLSTSLCLHPSP